MILTIELSLFSFPFRSLTHPFTVIYCQYTAVQQSFSRPACVAVLRPNSGECCLSVLLCFVRGSCPVPCCCVRGQGPFPIVCCHMEASTNTEISLSSCCSLTFSGTQLALNAEIIIIPITQPALSPFCVLRVKGVFCKVLRETLWREVPH